MNDCSWAGLASSCTRARIGKGIIDAAKISEHLSIRRGRGPERSRGLSGMHDHQGFGYIMSATAWVVGNIEKSFTVGLLGLMAYSNTASCTHSGCKRQRVAMMAAVRYYGLSGDSGGSASPNAAYAAAVTSILMCVAVEYARYASANCPYIFAAVAKSTSARRRATAVVVVKARKAASARQSRPIRRQACCNMRPMQCIQHASAYEAGYSSK